MKLALITLSTPTPDNVRTASALGYHIAKYRHETIELSVFSYNLNKVQDAQIKEIEKELNCTFQILPISALVRHLFKPWTAPIRAFIPKPMLAYLDLSDDVLKKLRNEFDAYWIYGEDISHLANHFKPKPTVITTPDCEALFYHRMLGAPGIAPSLKAVLRNTIMLQKYAKMESNFPIGKNIKYHLVGKADRDFLELTCPGINAVFIPHPHYNFISKQISFSQEKIRVLIAGRNDFYMRDKCEEVTKVLVNNNQLASKCEITFLGKNWDNLILKLKSAGYNVEYKTFVENYKEELNQHDVQLTPISVGTGTKGKVLDAIANGLLVIGTRGALENIVVHSGESCYEYDNAEEIVEIINSIYADRNKAEQIAETGRKRILDIHGRTKIANTFFALFDI